MEQVGADKEQGIVNETALKGSCSHIPCNQVETRQMMLFDTDM